MTGNGRILTALEDDDGIEKLTDCVTDPKCSSDMPQSTCTCLRNGVLPALNNRAHFPRMLSVLTAKRQAPFPARAMPSHIALETPLPIPRANTRSGPWRSALFTALSTTEIVPGKSYACPVSAKLARDIENTYFAVCQYKDRSGHSACSRI